MKKNNLGNTNLEVSKLCFGTLTTSPLQRNFTPRQSASLFKEAYDRGVNFYDTAEKYYNYAHLREFLKLVDRESVVITSKTYAYNEKKAKESFFKALREMKTDYIDIFLLHEQINHKTVKGHFEALEFLLKMKEQGLIKALGLSTHHISGVKAAGLFDEIEIVHPIINSKGIGIVDGNISQMENQLREIKNKYNKGIYGMKPLGGGNLLNQADDAFEYIKSLNFLDSIAIGMQSVDEIEYNVKILNDQDINNDLKNRIKFQNRKLIIADWCTGCGKCSERCQQNAIKVNKNNKAVVDSEKCTLCGYCAGVCKEFCIKII